MIWLLMICLILYVLHGTREPFLDDKGNCIFSAASYKDSHTFLRSKTDAQVMQYYLDHPYNSPCGDFMPKCRFTEQEYKSLNPDVTGNGWQQYREQGIRENRPVCGGADEYPNAMNSRYDYSNMKVMPY